MRVIQYNNKSCLSLKDSDRQVTPFQILITATCLSNDQKIKVPGKNILISEIPVNTNFDILSYDLKSKKVEIDKAQRIYSGLKEVYELTTESGLKVKSTKEHTFFVLENGRIVEKELKDIKEGDEILVE